jgi:Cu(I)/Ag(I) efflux system membrane fusion protein
MTAEQIVELETRGTAESRTRISAPIGGTVIEKSVTEGQYLKTGDVICRIADLSVVWLKLRLFPDDIGHIRYGQRVEAEVQSVPGEIFTGRVAFIDPVVDEKTRTIVVRVEMLNSDGRLRPGDFATATVRVPGINGVNVYDEELAGKWISPRHPQIVRSQPGTCPLSRSKLVRTSEFGYSDEPLEEQVAIVVPREAVLMAGSNSVVYVETKPGRFEIRRVIVGPMTVDSVVIVAGIKSGETVATAGNFLIDSQMQLSGKPSLIDPSRAKSAAAQIAIVPSDAETK